MEDWFMQGLANSHGFVILVFVVPAVGFLLATLIGLIRGVDRLALVFLVNLIGAPTGIGWVAALILAFGPRRLPAEPTWAAYSDATYGPARTWTSGPRVSRVEREGDGYSR